MVPRSLVRQRTYEKSRLEHTFRETSANIQAEVETAVRNVATAYQLSASRRESLQAVNAEVEYQEARWIKLRGDRQLGQLQLERFVEFTCSSSSRKNSRWSVQW